MSPDKIAFKGEMQLLSWSNSATGGPKVVLALADEDSLEQFKLMTLKKGKRAGQRLMTVMVEIDEQEQPVEQEQSGPKRSQLAYLMCEDGDFQRWANANQWDIPVTNSDEAREFIIVRCGIESRSELDRNMTAAVKFDVLRQEYLRYIDGAYVAGVRS